MTVLPITDFGRPRRLWQPVIEARQWMRIIGGSVFLFGVAASAWSWPGSSSAGAPGRSLTAPASAARAGVKTYRDGGHE
jgi:hypothetical protein